MDRITYLAGEALDVTAVCAALVDAEQGLLTSSYGLPVATALLISHALRKQVLATGRPLVVSDARRDPRVSSNPAVRDGTVRACVGMPLGTATNRAIGTLLALDHRTRRWTAPQLDLLRKLSAMSVDVMEVTAAVRRASQARVGLERMPLTEGAVEIGAAAGTA